MITTSRQLRVSRRKLKDLEAYRATLVASDDEVRLLELGSVDEVLEELRAEIAQYSKL